MTNVNDLRAEIDKMLKGPGRTPVEHWLNNLERFPPDHIGYRYAVEALAKLAPALLIEHMRKTLKRFPPGHIGHTQALEVLKKLDALDPPE